MRTTVVFTTHSSKEKFTTKMKYTCSISNDSLFLIGLLLPYADQIVILADGRISEKGALKDLIASSSYIQAMNVKTYSACNEEIVASDEKASTRGFSHIIGVDEEEESVPDSAESTLNELSEDDTARQKGDFSDYIYYLRATGLPVVAGFFGTVAFWAFCRQFPSTSSGDTVSVTRGLSHANFMCSCVGRLVDGSE